jgi:sodium-dependent dicarboxylate transporter 2/3/5
VIAFHGFFAKILTGPAAFLLIYLLPLQGLPYNGRIAFATFVWAVVWWMARPIPWGISSLLPLVVFPVLGVIGGLGIGITGLPFLAAGATVVGTNLFSGTAAATLFCSIFIPTAQEVGFNPASMAILIPNVAVGILIPWAGASAGTAFASGFLDMREMIKVGVVASLLIFVITTLIHRLFAPIL